MTLPIDVRTQAIARRSAKREPWSLEFSREIGPEDLILLATQTASPDPKAPLARIRDPHHALARRFAKGEKVTDISRALGYSPSRLYVLQRDPAFQELVAHYAEEEALGDSDIQAQIRHMTLTSLSLIQERLEDTPDEFSNKELRELVEAGLDRIGHGPSSNINLKISDPSQVIGALKEALALEAQGQILARDSIEAEYQEITDGQAEASPESAMGQT